MHLDPTTPLRRGRLDADQAALARSREGAIVVRTLGHDLPVPLLHACGLAPVGVAPSPQPHPPLPAVSLNAAGRQQLAAVLVLPLHQPLLVATNDPTGAMLFAVLRELMRTGELAHRPLHGIDLLRPHDAGTARYNRARLDELTAWASALGGRSPDRPALQQAQQTAARQRALLDQLDEWRQGDAPRLSGAERLNAAHAADVLPPAQHVELLQQLLAQLPQRPVLAGERVLVAGAEPEDDTVFCAIEAAGVVIVADDGGLSRRMAAPWPASDDPWQTLAVQPAQAAAVDPIERAGWTVAHARRTGATRILHVLQQGDEAQPWVRRWLASACAQAGLPLCPVDLRAGQSIDELVRRALAPPDLAAAPSPETAAARVAASPATRPPRANAAAPDQRSRKSLEVVADFSRYQRDWFQQVRARALGGEPFAVINADAPQEILRAFDIPFVVNQWWASIVAAKQQSGRYLGLLRAQGYPTQAEAYSAQGLAAAFDTDAEQAPWGGLPAPQWLFAFDATAATRGIYSSWAQHTGAELCLFHRTVDTRVTLPDEWWQRLPHEWDELLEKPRLDLIESEFAGAIERIERSTGRRFDAQRFRAVMHLVNEQEAYFRSTRDLIAGCEHAPVGIVDTMPATMVPQWHRGTVWGRDAARALYEEVRSRVEQGKAACAGERLRLMWVGRGLWSDMSFYQRWEQSHGAVFVWSMYLALAADGYLRYFDEAQSPLRALAARFVTMGDELRMPTWAGAWHVHEARSHRVDAAIAIDDADPLVLAALERAGVPVLRLALDNFAGGPAGLDDVAAQVTACLDHLA